jgi:hypothetical protein
MPRKYKRASESRKYGYDEIAMKNALEEIRDKGTSVKRAAFLYGVNRTTLMNHMKGIHCGRVGGITLLTPDEEKLIVHALIKLGEWGFGIDREAVKTIVMDYLKSVEHSTRTADGKPSQEFILSFERRHASVLSRRIGQTLPANRAYACNPLVVQDFFDKLQSVFDRCGLRDRPQNVFNVDETGFQTDIGKPKLLCGKGSRNPHKTVASTNKTMYTVATCCSAVGQFLPMYVVYKGKNIYSTWCQDGPEGTRYNCSDSGWMESEQFFDWFQKIFVEGTKDLDGSKLLIFDGHNSHINTRVVELAMSNNIELFCLPAHTSSILQPLDVGVFKTVKGTWRRILREYYDATRYSNVDKRVFPSLLKQLVLANAFSGKNAVSAFEACGIYPLNREKITADKLAVSEPLTSEACTNAGGSPSHDCVLVPVSMDAPNAPTLPIVTPRKRLEAAILSHLKQITPSAVTTAGRKRVRRTLAESLTSSECLERLQKEDEGKHAKKLPKVQKKQQDTRCTNKSKGATAKKSGNKSKGKAVVVRKPTWFKGQGAVEFKNSTNDVPVVSDSEASDEASHHDNLPAATSTAGLSLPLENALSPPHYSSTQPTASITYDEGATGTIEASLPAGWF